MRTAPRPRATGSSARGEACTTGRSAGCCSSTSSSGACPSGRAAPRHAVEWAVGQAREVGAARGLDVQQIDTGAFADDERQHRWLSASGFERVRTWWQMSRPVTPDEVALVTVPAQWSDRGRPVPPGPPPDEDGMPDEEHLRAVHDVLEEAFTDHFNSKPETFDEFLHRLREDPGHRWDHWWLASLEETGEPVGALVTVTESRGRPRARTGPTSPTSAWSRRPAGSQAVAGVADAAPAADRVGSRRRIAGAHRLAARWLDDRRDGATGRPIADVVERWADRLDRSLGRGTRRTCTVVVAR